MKLGSTDAPAQDVVTVHDKNLTEHSEQAKDENFCIYSFASCFFTWIQIAEINGRTSRLTSLVWGVLELLESGRSIFGLYSQYSRQLLLTVVASFV